MLAAAMQNRISSVANALTPKGSRPPFTKKQTAKELLAFWAAHRYDQYGAAQLAGKTPMQIAELDTWLAQALGHPAAQNLTPMRPAAQIPGAQSVLTNAMGAERRMEGPPPGPEVA